MTVRAGGKVIGAALAGALAACQPSGSSQAPGSPPARAEAQSTVDPAVLERVRKIVIEHLDADPAKVTEMANFTDDLNADSLDHVELVMAFEEEFDVEVPDDAAEHIQTVGDAARYLSARVRATPAT